MDEISVDEKYDTDTRDAMTSPNQQERKDNDNKDEEEEEEDKKKTAQFWQTLDSKFKSGDIEFIKELIRKNEIKMDEFNPKRRNLLMISTQYGSYELVSMCINLGANIDAEDNQKQTALKIAISNGYSGTVNYISCVKEYND